jgi:formylglycine-generating enzyme required for sulfatase activity
MSRRIALLLIGILLCPIATVPGHAQERPDDTSSEPGAPWEVSIPGTELSLRFAYVPGGSFELGSPPDEPGRGDEEGPVRRVAISGLWFGVHEIPHEAFLLFRHRDRDSGATARADAAAPASAFDVDAISRPSPPYDDPAHGMGADGTPATGMTRRAALLYARWLSLKTGHLFRLPTEAEWEFACRAGGGMAFGFGDQADGLDEYGWYAGNSGGGLHPVGARTANAWGLHDMHGNAAEWVMDSYRAQAYARLPEAQAAVDPMTGDPGRGRGLVRGGSYRDEPARLRCAARQPEAAAWKRRDPQIPKSSWWNTDAPHVGFRLVGVAGEHSREEIRAYWEEVLGAE